MTDDRYRNLSILMLKDSFTTFDHIIKSDPTIEKHDIKIDSTPLGTLYIKSSYPAPPKWASFFKDVIDIDKIGENTAVGAALLIRSEDRIFAITFGSGRYLLQTDCWVERFGLRVALNSIGKDKIRTIDKSTFDAISRHSKEQASKETDARDFGIDVEQDLLKAVTGSPKDSALGKRIYGMDSLSITTKITIEEIKDLLELIYSKYIDDSYKKDFYWVDHIGEVKDKTVIEELDTMICSKIMAGKTDKIWMAVPEIVDWGKVGGFCYSMNKNASEYNDIHLPHFIESLNEQDQRNICKETFIKRHVRCIDSEGTLMHEWQAYKCIYAELSKKPDTYILSGGKWYVVARDFASSVNKSYLDIPNYKVNLPRYNDDSEGKYNERISKELADMFALMHGKSISYGAAPLEFCDLFSINKDIVHVKRYGNSSVLSHLFAQGRSYGELFQMEREFRGKVNEKLPYGFKIKNIKDRPKSDEYQVVYAIISDAAGDLDIPFFSKLNLKNSARNLNGLGYRVAKLKIDVDEKKRKLRKFREKIKQH